MSRYAEWLKTQPVEVQNDILGTEQASKFRDGTLTVEKFVNVKPLSLEDFVSKSGLIASKSSKEPANGSTES